MELLDQDDGNRLSVALAATVEGVPAELANQDIGKSCLVCLVASTT